MVFSGVIKGWHRHRVMTLTYAVLVGKMLVAFWAVRPDSPTKGTLTIQPVGEGVYMRVSVPPMVWNAFAGLADTPSYVANCATHPHDPDEIERIDPHDPSIPIDWDVAIRLYK